MTNRTCIAPDCEAERKAKGYCTGHYKQHKAGKPITPLRKTVRYPEGATCKVEGCNNRPAGNWLCMMHYMRKRLTGDVGDAAPTYIPGLTAVERFHHIGYTARPVRPHLDECWEWNGPFYVDGYGDVSGHHRGIKRWKAHRLSYELANGVELTSEQFVCHRCDNPACIRPTHLFVGTHRDNVADCIAKGRNVRGEKTKNHKLTDKAVAELRKYQPLPTDIAREYARTYNASMRTVQKAATGVTWKHVPMP